MGKMTSTVRGGGRWGQGGGGGGSNLVVKGIGRPRGYGETEGKGECGCDDKAPRGGK